MDQPASCSDPIDCYNSQTISYRDALISLGFSDLKAGCAGSRFPSHYFFFLIFQALKRSTEKATGTVFRITFPDHAEPKLAARQSLDQHLPLCRHPGVPIGVICAPAQRFSRQSSRSVLFRAILPRLCFNHPERDESRGHNLRQLGTRPADPC